MNNLPLQPLVWSRALTVQSAFHQYLIRKDDEATKTSKSQYVVNYGRLNTQKSMNIATGFATIDEAKQWAWNHYNEKMQPYVKPMPTWIDVDEREPTEKGDYLIRDYQGRVAMGKYDKGFYMESGGEKWGCVQFWMPIPEFSTMQNLHKGE